MTHYLSSSPLLRRKLCLVPTIVAVFISIAPGCSSDKDTDVYNEYMLFCDIVKNQYQNFKRSDQSCGEKVKSIGSIEEQISKNIKNEKVQRTWSTLMRYGSEDPYQDLIQTVESETGKQYACEAFKKLTVLYQNSKC